MIKNNTRIKHKNAESRVIKADGIEIRRSATGSGNTISGIGIAYDSLSQDLGGFLEKFQYGSVKTDDSRMLFNHDYANVLGRESAGTLTLRDTPQGLKYSCDLPNTQLAKDLAVSLSRGDISGVSFGFVADKDSWDVVNGEVIRTVTAARVFELSVVADPAYLQSTVNLRSLPSKYRHLVTRDSQLDTDDGDTYDALLENCSCDPSDDDCGDCPLCAEARAAGHTVCVRSAKSIWTWATNHVPGSPVPKMGRSQLLQSLLLRRL